jgi:hypothetical protein
LEFKKGDLADLKGPGGTVPKGEYEVVSQTGTKVTIRHFKTDKRMTVDATSLRGFVRKEKSDQRG